MGARIFDDASRGILRIFKAQGQRAIAPGIFEDVAAVGAEDHIEAKFFRRADERARLIARRRREQKEPPACDGWTL
jgi:hypothetical protein